MLTATAHTAAAADAPTLPPLPLPHTTDMALQEVGMCRSLARAAIDSSLDAVNPCGLPPGQRLLLSMSPHVVVPDAVERDEQLAAYQQYEQQQQHDEQGSESGSPAAAAAGGDAAEDAISSSTQQLLRELQAPASNSSVAARVGSNSAAGAAAAEAAAATLPAAAMPALLDSLSDPLEASSSSPDGGPLEDAAAVQGSGSNAPDSEEPEPEYEDPLRRRTLDGDTLHAAAEPGLLSEDLGLSEAELEEAAGAAAAGLAGQAPRVTQGLQLYDRCVCACLGWGRWVCVPQACDEQLVCWARDGATALSWFQHRFVAARPTKYTPPPPHTQAAHLPLDGVPQPTARHDV